MAPSAGPASFKGGIKRPQRYKRGTLVLRKMRTFSFTPLHLAAMNGKRAVVEILLNRGNTLRGGSKKIMAKKNYGGETPLHLAAHNGHVDIVSLLLGAGAEPNASDRVGNTPLHDAVNQKHFEAAQILVKAGADPAIRNSIGQTALHEAARTDHVGLVKLFLEANLSPNTRDSLGRNALHLAAESPGTSAAEILLRLPLDIREKTNDGRIALDYAFSGENWRIVEILLEMGGSTRDLAHTEATFRPLVANQDIITLLKQHVEGKGRPVDMSVLSAATRLQNEALISQLLKEHGVDINSHDYEGTTSLHIAAAEGNCKFASLLLGYGADIYQRDLRGHTALHLAVLHGQPETLGFLLQTFDLAKINQDFFAAFSKSSRLGPKWHGVCFDCSSFEMLEPSLLALAKAGSFGVLKAFFELQNRSVSRPWELKASPASSKSLTELLLDNNLILDWENPAGKEIIGHYLQTYPEGTLRLIKIAKEEFFVDSFLEAALDIAIHNGVDDIVDFLLQRGVDPAKVQSRSILIIGKIFEEMERELSSIPAQGLEKKTLDELKELRRALSGLNAERMDGALSPWCEILHRIPFAALACGNEGLLRMLPMNVVARAGKDMQGCTLLQRAYQLGHMNIVNYILEVDRYQ